MMLEVTDTENIMFLILVTTQSNPSTISLPLPGHITCHAPSLCIFYPSHHYLLFAVQSDPWMAAFKSPTGKGFPMLSTAACGDGQTFTVTTSCAPSRPASMPSTSRRTRSASTPTTTREWRHQVRQVSVWQLPLTLGEFTEC